MLKANPNDELAGEIVRWSVADGFAQYIVWRSKPLELVHIDLGDAYALQGFAERGLILADVKAKIEAHRRMSELFAMKRNAG